MRNRHITFKVALGYILLVGLLGVALWVVARTAGGLARISETGSQVSARRQAVERLVTSLLATANSEQMLLAGVSAGETHYLAALSATLLSVDSLSVHLSDSLQRSRLDTLRTLLVLKCENSLRLAAALRDDEAARTWQRRISDFRSGRDSVVVPAFTASSESLRHRTYVVERTSRGFFRRLADAFRPSHADTVYLAERSESPAADTLRSSINVTDTVARVLADIGREVRQGRDSRRQELLRRRSSLWRSGADLTARMERLVAGFRAEEDGWMQSAVAAERLSRRSAAWTMGAMTAAALCLSALLFLLVWRDVAKARRYAREIEEAREQAECLMAQRERLLLTVSHDIKAPAAAISGYVEMLRPFVATAVEPSVRLYVDHIGSSAAHLLHLVTALLDYHRLERGAISLQPVPFVPAILLDEAAAAFRPQATDRHLRLDVRLSPSASRPVVADAFRIRQMLDNLLGNAVKFTVRGGVTLSAEVTGGHLCVSVSDTGPGLSESERRHIFEAFTRLPASQGVEGVGLGLSITRELARLLHAGLSVSSEPGRGSTFSFRVPVAGAAVGEVPPPASAGDSAEAGTMPPQVCPLRILVIDDDRIALQLTVGMLRKVSAGQWQVTACRQVDALWEALASQTFDLLLTDIEMPALNGFQLLAQIRERYPAHAAMPVVALSAHGLLQDEDFRRAGFAANLSKPFTAARLAELVCRLASAPASTSGAQAPESTSDEALSREEPAPPSGGGYAFSALTAFAEGDDGAAREIMRQFAADTRRHAGEFAAAVAQSDKAGVCRLAHKMLPTLMLIQAPVVRQLERLNAGQGQTGWTSADTADCRRIQEELDRILQALAEI